MKTGVTVSRSAAHTFGKPNQLEIRLVAGLGVAGDAHLGETVKHRSRVARDPTQPNLRQVHLLHAELFDELKAKGFDIGPGEIRSEEHTSELQSLMRSSYAVFCLKKK